MYVDEFIEQIKSGRTVNFQDGVSYFGLRVNESATAVYLVSDNILRPGYVGFINHMRNCYYVDDNQVYDEAFRFDDFKDGWSFNVHGCEYMDSVVCGKEQRSFKSDLMLKKIVLQRYYKSMGEEIKKLIGDNVDVRGIKINCKGSYWFSSTTSCVRMSEQECINRSIKSVEHWGGVDIDWHKLAFGLSQSDDYIKNHVKSKIMGATNESLEEYKKEYIVACAEYNAFHNLLTKPYDADNLYYWLCLDIKRVVEGADKAMIKMMDGKTYQLRNLVLDVSETSYVGGDCGKGFQFCPFVSIATVEINGVKVYDRDRSIQRLQSTDFLEALNDMMSKEGNDIRKLEFGDLVFSEGQFGIVLSANTIFCEDGKFMDLKTECVVCNTSFAGLRAMKEKLVKVYEKCGMVNKNDLNRLKGIVCDFKGDKDYGYER